MFFARSFSLANLFSTLFRLRRLCAEPDVTGGDTQTQARQALAAARSERSRVRPASSLDSRRNIYPFAFAQLTSCVFYSLKVFKCVCALAPVRASPPPLGKSRRKSLSATSPHWRCSALRGLALSSPLRRSRRGEAEWEDKRQQHVKLNLDLKHFHCPLIK